MTFTESLAALLADGYIEVEVERDPYVTYDIRDLVEAYAGSLDDGWTRDGPRVRHRRHGTLRGERTRAVDDRRRWA